MDTTGRPDLSSLRIRRDDAEHGTPRGRRRRWPWLAALLLVVAAAAFFVARGRERTFHVETATVQRLAPAGARSLLTATGYVVAQRKAAVASKGTGRLEVLNVEEGDRVVAGDVIGRLEATDMTAALQSSRAKIRQAEADVDRARAELREAGLIFDRSRSLAAQGLLSQADLDAAEAGHATAEADVKAKEAAVAAARADAAWAEVQVENTYIRAPFDGTVLTKDADVGEVVAPFASSASSKGAVVTLADMSSLEVEVDVSESNIRQTRPGQPCLITLDALPGEPYRGRVKKIVPTADRARATVLTKVSFDSLDARVLPEMSATVNFLPQDSSAVTSTRTILGVPAGAVVERDGTKVAFVVREGRAARVAVETGEAVGGILEARSGLREGDIVVVDPPSGLGDGSRIDTTS